MDAMPKILNVNYANDNRTVIIGVELLPGKEYGITLLGLSFRTPEGDGIKPYEISFRTAQWHKFSLIVCDPGSKRQSHFGQKGKADDCISLKLIIFAPQNGILLE